MSVRPRAGRAGGGAGVRISGLTEEAECGREEGLPGVSWL